MALGVRAVGPVDRYSPLFLFMGRKLPESKPRLNGATLCPETHICVCGTEFSRSACHDEVIISSLPCDLSAERT